MGIEYMRVQFFPKCAYMLTKCTQFWFEVIEHLKIPHLSPIAVCCQSRRSWKSSHRRRRAMVCSLRSECALANVCGEIVHGNADKIEYRQARMIDQTLAVRMGERCSCAQRRKQSAMNGLVLNAHIFESALSPAQEHAYIHTYTLTYIYTYVHANTNT